MSSLSEASEIALWASDRYRAKFNATNYVLLLCVAETALKSVKDTGNETQYRRAKRAFDGLRGNSARSAVDAAAGYCRDVVALADTVCDPIALAASLRTVINGEP